MSVTGWSYDVQLRQTIAYFGGWYRYTPSYVMVSWHLGVMTDSTLTRDDVAADHGGEGNLCL